MSHRPYPSWECALNQLWRHHSARCALVRAFDRDAFVDFVFDTHPHLQDLDAMLDNLYRTEDQ